MGRYTHFIMPLDTAYAKLQFFHRKTFLQRKTAHLIVTLILLGLTITQASPGSAQGKQASLPILTRDELGHPRLFFEAEDIPYLQQKADTTHAAIWQPIYTYATELVKTSPPLSTPSENDLETFRLAGNQLIVPAFTCVVSAEPAICTAAKQYLLAYATWPQWDKNDRRDLGLAHMLMGNALAYDWLHPLLSEPERRLVRESLADRASDMYAAGTLQYNDERWQNWWRNSYIQNHYSTNTSALGLVGLALLGEDSRAPDWIAHAQNNMTKSQQLLDGIGDGTWHEGIPYQNYALTMMLPFLVNLRDIRGVDIFPHDYLRQYSDWRLWNLLPGSSEFALPYGNFEASWNNDYGPQSLLRFVASEYQDGYAEWTAQQITAAMGRRADRQTMPWYVFEFLYFDPQIPVLIPTDRAMARTFSDLGAVLWRTGWGSEDLVFGLKSGTYGGRYAFDTFTRQLPPWNCTALGCEFNIGHEHDDNNGFYIWRAGQWLAPESTGYDRYETALHNTLLIDGQGQYRPQDWRDPSDVQGSTGSLAATANTSRFNLVVADTTGRYRNTVGIENITRYVLFVRPNYLIMLDDVAADAAHEYEWIVHFGADASIDGNWLRGDADDGQILGVGVASPQAFLTSIGDDGRPYVRMRPAAPVAAVRFVNLLYPTDKNGWDARPIITLDDDTDEATLVTVQWEGKGQGRDDIVLRHHDTASSSVAGAYTYDGLAAVVSRRADNDPQRLFMYRGRSLLERTTGITWVTTDDPESLIEAVYTGQALSVEVQGKTNTMITLYAPDVDSLAVNGTPHPFVRLGDSITFSSTVTTFAWAVDQGAIEPPFKTSEDSLMQTTETLSPGDGGKASYRFYLPEPGDYLVTALVDAPNDGSNSFFVNIDAEPDPTMIWDIPPTKGFEERAVSWREEGIQQIFRLDQGEHELIIRGREGNARLAQISIELLSSGLMMASPAGEHD